MALQQRHGGRSELREFFSHVTVLLEPVLLQPVLLEPVLPWRGGSSKGGGGGADLGPGPSRAVERAC